MKRSYDTLSVSHMSWKRRDILSANARGSTPCARRPRRLRHLQPVLVGTGLEADFTPLTALKTRDGVGGDRFIRVANMRRTVRVADGSGDVEGVAHRDAL